MKTVLIVGATGIFGSRLARHLAQHSKFKLILAARNADRLKALAETLPRHADWIAFDRATAPLADIRPWAVIDCSGPFQSSDYAFATRCIESGVHFIDLADAKDYLSGFGDALDTLAKKHAVTALCGASSTPALSTAVVEALSEGWHRLDTVDIAITPGGRSKVGRAVIAAVMSYAGRPVGSFEHGRAGTKTGWHRAKRLAMPGLGTRLVSPVETFDAQHLSPRVTNRVSFSAGLESWLEHRGLNLIAALRRLNLFPDPGRFTTLFLAARKLTRLTTSTTGGMDVRLSGLGQSGRLTCSRWTLIARNNEGLYVPVMAAAAALRALAEGTLATGAGLANLPLGQITQEMTPYNIETQTKEQDGARHLFPREGPATVQSFHNPNGPPIWQGRASIQGAESMLGRFIAKCVGFPQAGENVPVRVSIDRSRPGREIWTHNFGGKQFSSTLTKSRHGIIECFGPFCFTLRPTISADALHLPLTGWSAFGIPLPLRLAPRAEACEQEATEQRFLFNILISLAFLGKIVHYRGWLEPESSKF